MTMSSNLPAVMSAGSSTPAPIESFEWTMIKEQAAIMANTEVVPKQYRGKPHDIIAAGLYGRELGLGLATSLNLIDVIEGNPEISAEGKLALIRARGHSVTGGVDDDKAWMRGRRADTGDELEVVFTWAEAERIMVTKWTGPQNSRKKVQEPLVKKDNWQNFRQDMMWARCATRLGRRLFGDVLQGFSYDREEIKAHILDTGDDPMEVMNQAPPDMRMVRSAPVVTTQAIATQPEPVAHQAEIIEAEVVPLPSSPAPEPVPTPLVSEDPPIASGPKLASAAQHRYIEKLLTDEGLASDNRDGRHQKMSDLIGRNISSFDELTVRDASLVIDALSNK